MPVYQNNSNILVAIKRETSTGVAAGATSGTATRVRLVGSPGLELKRAVVQSAEKRGDGLTSMGRLGGKSLAGSYNGEISAGGAVDLHTESVMRSTWVAAVPISFVSVTTVAIGSNTLTNPGSDWIAAGVRVGDIFTLSGTSLAANNSTNNPVTAVSTNVITTVLGAFTTLAATATGTITIAKKVKTATTPTRYSHSIEQYDADVDLSELFLGCRAVGMKLSFKPGQMATISYMYEGMDRTILTTGTSPWFIAPTLTTGLELIADDASIRKAGVVVATFTGFDLDFSIKAKGENVLGSFVPADIFDNDMVVSGSISALRSDFANLTSFDAETEFELGILLQEPTTAPKPFFAVYLPRVKFSGLSAPVGGGDGAKVETLSLMIGPRVAATGYDAGIATFATSVP